MRVFLKAKVTETKNCKGIWLNTITVQLLDKRIVALDRDTTNYSINGHSAEITFLGTYIKGLRNLGDLFKISFIYAYF